MGVYVEMGSSAGRLREAFSSWNTQDMEEKRDE